MVPHDSTIFCLNLARRLKWFSTCLPFQLKFLRVVFCLAALISSLRVIRVVSISISGSETMERLEEVSVADVTVHSLKGDILFETCSVSSIHDIHELADASAQKLNAKKCHMVSSDGKIISEVFDLKNQDRLTAVAQNVSPLLQLVGLQNAQGDLGEAYATVPMEVLEQIALEVAFGLTHIACWFGGPQHIAGSPSLPWRFGSVLPPPGPFNDEMRLRIVPSTPVVHLGAMVVLSITDALPCFPAVQKIRATRELTVDDIIKIRSAHQDACNKNKMKLLEQHPGADTVLATMRLVRYTAEEVFFELGHRASRLYDDI